MPETLIILREPRAGGFRTEEKRIQLPTRISLKELASTVSREFSAEIPQPCRMMSLAKFRAQSNTFMEFEGPPETKVATNAKIRATLYYDLDRTKVAYYVADVEHYGTPTASTAVAPTDTKPSKVLVLQLSSKPTTSEPPADLKPTVEFLPMSPEKTASGALVGQAIAVGADGDEIIAIDEDVAPGASVEHSDEQPSPAERMGAQRAAVEVSDEQAESVDLAEEQAESVEIADEQAAQAEPSIEQSEEPVEQPAEQSEPHSTTSSAPDSQSDLLAEFFAEIAPDLEQVDSTEAEPTDEVSAEKADDTGHPAPSEKPADSEPAIGADTPAPTSTAEPNTNDTEIVELMDTENAGNAAANEAEQGVDAADTSSRASVSPIVLDNSPAHADEEASIVLDEQPAHASEEESVSKTSTADDPVQTVFLREPTERGHNVTEHRLHLPTRMTLKTLAAHITNQLLDEIPYGCRYMSLSKYRTESAAYEDLQGSDDSKVLIKTSLQATLYYDVERSQTWKVVSL